MKRMYEQWCSTSPISTKQTGTFNLNWTQKDHDMKDHRGSMVIRFTTTCGIGA